MQGKNKICFLRCQEQEFSEAEKKMKEYLKNIITSMEIFQICSNCVNINEDITKELGKYYIVIVFTTSNNTTGQSDMQNNLLQKLMRQTQTPVIVLNDISSGGPELIIDAHSAKITAINYYPQQRSKAAIKFVETLSSYTLEDFAE